MLGSKARQEQELQEVEYQAGKASMKNGGGWSKDMGHVDNWEESLLEERQAHSSDVDLCLACLERANRLYGWNRAVKQKEHEWEVGRGW